MRYCYKLNMMELNLELKVKWTGSGEALDIYGLADLGYKGRMWTFEK